MLVRSFSFSYFSSYKITSIVYEQAKARWNIDHYTPIYCNVHPSALQFKKNGEKNSKKIGQRRHNNFRRSFTVVAVLVIDKILVVIIL